MTRHTLRVAPSSTTPLAPLYEVYDINAAAIVGHIYNARPSHWQYHDAKGIKITTNTLPRLRTEIRHYFEGR